MTETFAVALVGDTDGGWLVEAASTTHATDIVQETVVRARKVPRRELLVWRANYYRERNLADGPAPGGFNREVSARRRETRAPQCPVPPESLGPETALARREPGKLPGQDPNEVRLRHEFRPSGQIPC